jgi:hypothetical protein
MKLLLLPLFVCCLLLLSGCAKEQEPELELPEDLIVRILEDIHLAESATQDLSLARRDSILPVYYDRILREHGVDSARWGAVLTELRGSPTTLDRIYQRVSDSLEVRNVTVREQVID